MPTIDINHVRHHHHHHHHCEWGEEDVHRQDIKLLRQWGEEYDDNTALSAGLGVDLDERLRALERAVEGIDVRLRALERAVEGIDVSQSFIDIEIEGGTLIALGETKKVRCKVYQGWTNITNKVKSWEIIRESSDPASDSMWNASEKARTFNAQSHVDEAVIDLKWTQDAMDSDIDTNQETRSTTFKITAVLDNDTEIERQIEL